MIFTLSMGAVGPYILSMRDLYMIGGPQFTPKRHKLKGYQKCQKKRK